MDRDFSERLDTVVVIDDGLGIVWLIGQTLSYIHTVSYTNKKKFYRFYADTMQ